MGVASVLALVYFALFVDFTNHGCIWDRLSARVPALAKFAPHTAPQDSTTSVIKGGAAQDEAASADRTLIVAEQAPAPSAKPQSPARSPVAAAAPAQAAARPAPTPHLTSSLTPFNIIDDSQSNVIMAPAAQPGAQAAAAQNAAAPASAQSAAAPAVAAKTSYGAASRSEMMGQAAGPVYNLTGKK
jgi:hypothetical protein